MWAEFTRGDTMNNKTPIRSVIVGLLTCASVAAFADDVANLAITPLSELTGQQVLAARKAAKERWRRMTPAERLAASDTASGKQHAALTALDDYAIEHDKHRWSEAVRRDQELSSKRKSAQ